MFCPLDLLVLIISLLLTHVSGSSRRILKSNLYVTLPRGRDEGSHPLACSILRGVPKQSGVRERRSLAPAELSGELGLPLIFSNFCSNFWQTL